MMTRPTLCVVSCVIGLVGFFPRISAAQAPSATAPAGAAIGSIFDPWRAPPNKTMGLTQRSFVDLLEADRGRLEIALVLDATESMGDSLAGIRTSLSKMVHDLSLARTSEIAFQLVVFRDVSAKDQAIEFPMVTAGKQFTTDVQVLQTALDRVEARSGAPYFPEIIDAGIHAAITELAWSTEPKTTRWILVFGDAPPFDPGFEDEKTQARRRYDTSYLVSQAERKGIKIHCVLCTSRESEKQAYERVLDRTRSFMSSLATDTGGLMLDLSYPDIRKAIEDAAKQASYSSVKIGRITDQEIEQLRSNAEREKSLLSRNRRVSIAVLPHLPLAKLSFDSQLDEVRMAADLREKLRRIPGMDVKSAGAVQRQWESLQHRGVEEANLLPTLATLLDVDYILWGDVTHENNLRKVSSSIFEGVGGKKLVEGSAVINADAPMSNATSQITRTIMTNVLRSRSDQRLTLTFNNLGPNPAENSLVLTPVANVAEAMGPLLEGYDLLEKATEYMAGDPQADELLQRAERALQAALATNRDPENAFAQMLLANCYFNQAQILAKQKQTGPSNTKLVQFRASLNQAYRQANRLQRNEIKQEIKADHALLSQPSPTVKTTQEAIEIYKSLTKVQGDAQDPVSLDTALRAHWMLAGIYSGDWGVDRSIVDPNLAKEHLLQILAHWPDSNQARVIRTHLRWDAQAGENALEHYPLEHETVFTSQQAEGTK